MTTALEHQTHIAMTQNTVPSLNDAWAIYYRDQNTKRDSGNSSTSSFTNDMEKVMTVKTVEEFWQVIRAMPMPSKINRRTGATYLFFRDHIEPTWEDPQNAEGGMWRIVIKRHEDRQTYLDIFWLELLMALVGESGFSNPLEITGCVLKRRQKEDRIELWTRSGGGDLEVGESLKGILNLEGSVEFTKHDTVKQMDVVRRAGNRDASLGRRPSRFFGKNSSQDDVFKPEFKNRSIDYSVDGGRN